MFDPEPHCPLDAAWDGAEAWGAVVPDAHLLEAGNGPGESAKAGDVG